MVCAGEAGATLAYTWTEFTLRFSNLGGVEASDTALGLATLHTSSSIGSHLSTVTLAPGFTPGLTLDTSIAVTDPSAAPITSVVLDSVRPDLHGGILGNISGAIANSNLGILPNTLPQTGGITLCLLDPPNPPCSKQLALALGATTAGVQVGGGVGGILTIGGAGAIRASVVGAPYTVKTVSAVNRTESGGFAVFTDQGFAHGPASLTSSTAQTSGVLQIVTAQHVQSAVPGLGDRIGILSRARIHFLNVPEPGLALLLVAGAAGMLVLGRRRMRR
jgi:hypothetical protein